MSFHRTDRMPPRSPHAARTRCLPRPEQHNAAWMLLAALALLASLALTACGDSDDSHAAEIEATATPASTAAASPTQDEAGVRSAPARLEIDAADFRFTSLDEIPAGWVEVTFTNSGSEPHHAQFARLNEGVTLDQFEAALIEDEVAAMELVTLTGGPAVVDPGGEGSVLLNLPAGDYALICLVPSPDGHTHLEKGMIKSLIVTPPDAGAGSPDLPVIGMRDFAFEFPETLPAGPSMYEVVNDGPQIHEIAIIEPRDGVTADEALAALTGEAPPDGPPPFAWVGGMQALSPGETGILRLDLPPGDYVAVCMVPDPATGQPHIMLGMVQPFTVR